MESILLDSVTVSRRYLPKKSRKGIRECLVINRGANSRIEES